MCGNAVSGSFQSRSSIPYPPSEIYCNEPIVATGGRLTQDAEVAFPEGHFGGVGEGVGLAVGQRSHSPGLFKGAADVIKCSEWPSRFWCMNWRPRNWRDCASL